MITLTPQQEKARQRITQWWSGENPETTLTGYAGTGKSTAIATIINSLGVKALYLAPTGKAAAVLRAKTGKPARTIHSVLYTAVTHEEPRTGKDGKPVTGPDGKPLTISRITFEPRAYPHDDVTECGIIVVDEMSMVAKKEAELLRKQGKRIIAVGDPGQLPPVKADPGFIPRYIDLTDIIRQEQCSPVLEIATRVRNKQRPGRSGTSGDRARLGVEYLEFFTRPDRQILCWRHQARWASNRLVRTMLKRTAPVPEPGEKVSILRNNAMYDVYRGQQYTVKWTDYDTGPAPHKIRACLTDDDGTEKTIQMLTSGFIDPQGEMQAEQQGGDAKVAATWGYTITVHSSQGSEWRDVLVLDEPLARPRDRRTMDRWLYTAVTRATNRVMIARESMVV
ncbi:ATP-dependent RecD-like DNA helicase [Streptomyces sp. NPDC000927]|uniref:ATP-dependent DNA helicase n=1 Tax=Streptomyces sp. NPDC000927 TaxID=3154371 RepID=UPI00331DE83B